MTLSSDAEVDATDATEGGAGTTTAAILLPSRDDNDDDNDDEVEEEEDADDSVALDNDDNNDNDNDEASVIGHEEHPHDPPDTDEIVSDEDSHNNNDETTSTPLLPPKPKPVQRARLAYSIFCDENRSNIQAEVSVDQIHRTGRWTFHVTVPSIPYNNLSTVFCVSRDSKYHTTSITILRTLIWRQNLLLLN
jgi:hypothetical protein